MIKSIPPLNKPVFTIYFYHKVTGDIMKYKFMSYRSAIDFFDKLDHNTSRPTMYVSERIH